MNDRAETNWMERIRKALEEQAERLPAGPDRPRRLNRRTFLLGSTAAGVAWTRSVSESASQPATPVATPYGTPGASPVPVGTPLATPVFDNDPFTLGVASGDPVPDGVVLWTRLVPRPFDAAGGMAPNPVEVHWEIATDDRMRDVVQRGTAIAEAGWAHSVHVEVQGLQPDRWYWYQFRTGDALSPIGRTRTAPAAGAPVDRFRFAFASCQAWQDGLYTAYRDMAQQDIDLVMHLGDYIYESVVSGFSMREGDYPVSALMELRRLDDYRARYALYKLDPHLQEAHRVAPWIVTWDDHEVANDYAGGILRDSPFTQDLLERRAAAYQAYYEHQPLRASAKPKGPDLRLYRRLSVGDLVEFNVLDTRQYRTPQGGSCGDEARAANGGFCPESLNPDRTMLGDMQKQWLFDGFQQASARWNVLAQQVPMARMDTNPSPEEESFGGDMDKWDGYAAERDQVLETWAAAANARSFSPVVITGDMHANFVWDLRTNVDDPGNATVIATEFVGTSISSNGDNPLQDDGQFTTQCGGWNGNPHNHLYDNHRGYVLCEMTPEMWRSDYRVMPTVEDEQATASTLTSFVVEHGNPGAQQAAECPSSGDVS